MNAIQLGPPIEMACLSKCRKIGEFCVGIFPCSFFPSVNSANAHSWEKGTKVYRPTHVALSIQNG